MTDEDIKKALECCSKGVYAEVCDKCSFKEDGNIVNLNCLNLEKYALDLINRQQAEIERLKGWQDLLKAEKHSLIKAEAIKEFAERLKEAIIQENDLYVKCAKNLLSTDYQQGYEEKNNTIVKCIDNLLAEKVGEQNA